MPQIIREFREPSRSEKFGRAIQGAGESLGKSYAENLMMAQEDEDAKRLGLDLSGIRDPKKREKAFELALQGQHQSELQKQKFGFEKELLGEKQNLENEKASQNFRMEQQQKLIPYQNALDSVDRMLELRNEGKLGIGSSKFSYLPWFGAETARAKGEYQTLGNSLIQFATNIPIRNKVEFEKLAGHISDPDITDEEAKGILEALKNIINNNAQQFMNQGSQRSENKERPALEDIFG